MVSNVCHETVFALINEYDLFIDLIKRGRGPVKKMNNIRFKITNKTTNSEMKFNSDLLNLYLAIDEKKTLGELFKETKLNPVVFKKCLLNLLNLKLIKPIKVDDTAYINHIFLDRLREVLIDLSGPMGELLIEQAAEDMNLRINKIPVSKISDFVYQIASTIPGEKQAAEFKKIMVQEILDHQFNRK